MPEHRPPQSPNAVDVPGSATVAQQSPPRHLFDSTTNPTAPVGGERYELLEEIARGGMGVVYRAQDRVLDRIVAVKIAHPGQDTNRFVIESRVTAQLQHPGIPPVYSLDRLPDGRVFLAMKFISGRTLADEQKANTQPDLLRTLGVFEHLCQTVGFAHANSIIHRDLKPANVMIGAFGEVLVLDWGLAKSIRGVQEADRKSVPRRSAPEQRAHLETVAGQVKGTPAYMAPEQARGEPVDARTDVFALGGILAFMLTGMPPFVGKTVLDTVLRAAAADLRDCFARLDGCGADAGLVNLIKCCLAANPGERYSNGQDVALAVADYRTSLVDQFRRLELANTTANTRDQERRRSGQRVTWLVACFVGLAFFGLGLLYVLKAQEQGNFEEQRAKLLDKLNAQVRKDREALDGFAFPDRQAIHARVSEWLNDPTLPREPLWHGLSQKEKLLWTQFWVEVKSLHDRTLPSRRIDPVTGKAVQN